MDIELNVKSINCFTNFMNFDENDGNMENNFRNENQNIILVSIIITILNGEHFINECFNSILKQTAINDTNVKIEICVFDDASVDRTPTILNLWITKFFKFKIILKILQNKLGYPLGVGYGRNIAIKESAGTYLCFQDIDDEMFPNRITLQLEKAKIYKNAIIGSKFIRTPENATCRFTNWANNLTDKLLTEQIFTSHGPTVIMPTWFCHRNVYTNVGRFSELGKGTPEDLIFFYQHLDVGGTIHRINEILVNYKYHNNSTTFSIEQETIWKIRFNRLIKTVLIRPPWNKSFSIWNAGKNGRKFFRQLPSNFKEKVIAFCDVDQKKINKTYNYFEVIKRKVEIKIPIIHFTDVKPPIVICMKLDMTKGNFENNLKSMNLIEGTDYVLFT